MEKHWFILKKDHHIGPLNSREVVELLDSGEIDETSLIWKKGEEDWLPLAHYPEILREDSAFDLENEVPPPLNVIQFPVLPAIPINDENSIPAFNSDALNESVPDNKMLFDENEEQILKPSSDTPEQKVISSKFLKFMSAILLVLLGVMPFYFFDLSIFKKFVPLNVRDLESEQLEKLNLVAQDSKDNKPLLLLNKMGNKIYMASPLSGEYSAYLTLISLDGEVLSDQVISISSQGKLKNHFAAFDNFKIVSGENLKPGRYQYRLTLRRNTFFSKSMDKLNLDKNSAIIDQGQILMSKFPEEEFKEKLKQFHQLNQFNRNIPVHERLERYSTLMKTLETGYEQFQKDLSTISTGKEIKKFQDFYVKNVAMILQDIILDNFNQAEKWQKEKDELKAVQYNELFLYGKSIAGFFSECIEIVENKKGKLSAYDRGIIGNKTGEKFQFLLNKGSEKIKLFETELK